MNRLPSVLSQLRFWAGGEEPEGSDAQLLRQFLHSRDEAAFTALLRRHGPMVLGVCRRVLRHPSEEEDVFQATFLVLVRQGGSIRRHDALGSWLHGVAHRLACRVRADGIRRREHELRAGASFSEEMPSRTSDPEWRVILDEELGRLPEKYRGPLVLCCLEGKTLAEAARQLGWKVGTLAGRLARARALLAERLSRRGVAPGVGLVGATLDWASPLASVSSALLDSTVRLTSLSTDSLAEVGLSARVAVLAEGVLRAMFLKKMKVLVASAVIVACLAAGAVAVARQTLPGAWRPFASTPTAGEQRAADEPAARLDPSGDPLPAEAVARFGSTRLKHGMGTISSLHFTPDGITLLSQSDGEARAWDVTTGRQVRQFPKEAHPGNWHGTSLSPDGTILATPSANMDAIRLWDVATAKPIRAFGSGRFTRVCFSPDGKILASEGGGRFEILDLWDVATGNPVRSWKVDRGAEFATASVFTGDGKTLISAHRDNTVRFWDVATGKESARIALEMKGPRNLVRSPDGKLVAVTSFGFETPHIHLIDVSARKVVRRWLAPDKTDEFGYKQRFGEIVFTPDSKTLLAAGVDEDLIFFDVATGKERRRLKGGFTNLNCIALSRDGRTVASAIHGKTIRLTDLTTGRDLFEPAGHSYGVWSAQFAAGGKLVATVGGGKDVFLWDARTGRELRRLTGHTGSVLWVGLSADGSQVVSHAGGGENAARFWNPATGKELRKIVLSTGGFGPSFSPDGKSYFHYPTTSGGGNAIQLVDAATGKERWRVKQDQPGFRAMFTPDGKTVVASTSDQTVYLLDAATGEERKRYRIEGAVRGQGRGEGHLAYTLALSNDGKRLAYGNQLNSLLVLDTATGDVLHRLTRLPDGVSALAFAPGDRVLAWGGWNDPTIHLVELATGKERHRFAGTSGRVYTLSFSPDGRALLSGSEDTTAAAWDVAGRRTVRTKLKTADLEAIWADLDGDDAAKAFRLIQQLASSPNETIPYLRGKLKPVPVVDKARIKRLIDDLDSEEFATRANASAELDKQGEGILGPCEAALAGKPSLEVRRRLEAILGKLRAWRIKPSPDQLRTIRALEALELCDAAEARKWLAELAKGAEGAYLTEQAKAAVLHLGKSR